MTSGHVLGSLPAKDPVEEVKQASLKVTEDTEVKWDNRIVSRSWERAVLVVGLVVAVTVYVPVIVIVTPVLLAAVFVLAARFFSPSDWHSPQQSGWRKVTRAIPQCMERMDAVECRSLGHAQYVGALTIANPGSALHGDMSRLVRGVPTDAGLCLSVSMIPQGPSVMTNGDSVSEPVSTYLDALSEERLDAYITRRGGVWSSQATIFLHAQVSHQIKALASAVKGSVPVRVWKRLPPPTVAEKIQSASCLDGEPKFMCLGSELSEWLVQMRTELASEIGESVPGQFVAPIRSRPGDYRLGVTINPDTLATGPATGISHDDLKNGLLVCGGEHEASLQILALLTRELLLAGKRILLVVGEQNAGRLATLAEHCTLTVLGRDLVLNPMDPEDIPRNEYVAKLLSALEVIAGTDLANAPEFEFALSRAVAIGNTTLADVTVVTSDENVQVTAESQAPATIQLNRASQAGMDAVKTLYQGTGARAFYGNQSMSMKSLTQLPMSVVVLSTGSLPLDMLAWDLLCIKLCGLAQDKDLVVVLNEPANLLVYGGHSKNRCAWTERMITEMTSRFSVVLATEHPSNLTSGALAQFSSCVSLRVRNKYDIGVLSDILGLKVIETGLHSKARWSARESSFLRVMGDDIALMVRNGSETCQPLRLDAMPPLGNPREGERRAGISLGVIPERRDEGVQSLLLKRVLGRDFELGKRVLLLLERYEPLTELAIQKFISASDSTGASQDTQGVIMKLQNASMILPGHESHSGVSYLNFRITMKGRMALRQAGAGAIEKNE